MSSRRVFPAGTGRTMYVHCTYIVRTLYQLYVQCTYIVRTVPAGLTHGILLTRCLMVHWKIPGEDGTLKRS